MSDSRQLPQKDQGGAHGRDIYLSPHSDDVCFSLGGLARRRGAGTLITVFSISDYVEASEFASEDRDAVTRRRQAEDAAFAAACGLSARDLGFLDAPLRGEKPFDLGDVEGDAGQIEDRLMETVMAPVRAAAPAAKPMLFCPAGIGGHRDHLAVRTVVMKNLDFLARSYDVAFYEDLHYASWPRWRLEGLKSLARAMNGRSLYRLTLPLEEDAPRKLELIRIYRSQHKEPPVTLDRFSPAMGSAAPPHEACWVPRQDGTI